MLVRRVILRLDLSELLDLRLECQVSPLQVLDELMLGLHHQDLDVESVHFWLRIGNTFTLVHRLVVDNGMSRLSVQVRFGHIGRNERPGLQVKLLQRLSRWLLPFRSHHLTSLLEVLLLAGAAVAHTFKELRN